MANLEDLASQLEQQIWNQAAIGPVAQTGNPNVPARSNTEWLGIAASADGALATTGICTAVAIPVNAGDIVTTVSVPIGATAGATLTHGFAAIYSGIATPALQAQSTDIGTTAAITADKLYSFTLATPVTITEAMSPGGFIYASVSFSQSSGTIPTVVGTTLLATGAQYQWFTSGPLFYCATHGSAVGGTAPATIASPAVKAAVPYVVLT